MLLSKTDIVNVSLSPICKINRGGRDKKINISPLIIFNNMMYYLLYGQKKQKSYGITRN
jgi:hypothetical protein